MTVHLVGAGPGDPDLLTLRAARLLEDAEVVVHDRLIDPRVLGLARNARLIDVGKRPGGSQGVGDGAPAHTQRVGDGAPAHNSQEAINELLVDLGRAGFEVVRLKGGDPFLFGRGGEEAHALTSAGIPFTVTPGVTSAFAAPAAAGIPVTHRGVSAAVTVVTGHRQPGAPAVDWRSLARVGGTTVVLMGVAERSQIAAELEAGGLPGDTPVTVIKSATLVGEQIHRLTLAGVADAPIENPAVIVIGAVAAIDVTAVAHLATAVA